MAKTISRAPQRQRSLTWLQGLLCGALATVATPTALLLVVLPAEFDVTTLKTAPLSPAVVEAMEYVADVAPEMSVPLRRH